MTQPLASKIFVASKETVESYQDVDTILEILRKLDKNNLSEKVLENIFNHKKFEEIFLKLADENDTKVLKVLLKNLHTNSQTLKFSTFCKMRKIAHDKNFHNFSYELHKIEEKFYEIFKNVEEKISQHPKNYPQTLRTFHKNIESGNFEEVKKFVENFPHFKFCFDSNKICALEKAIDFENYEIFSFLLSQSFLAFNHEKIELKIRNLNSLEKRKIRDENVKFSKQNPENYLNILAIKCEIFSCSGLMSFKEIQKMLKNLNQKEELKYFLLNSSQADLKIIFDYATESVKSIDPTCSEHTMGIAYFNKGQLFVGKDRSELERFGTFAHELSHYVFYIIYENDCLPFCIGDNERENLWNQTFDATYQKFKQDKENCEEIIRFVFDCYEIGYVQSAELAVRVPHIIARFFNDSQKVQEIQKQFPELFNFFYTHILSDLKIINYRFIKLNNDFGVIKRIQESKLKVEQTSSPELITNINKRMILRSNVPQLTLSKIYNEIKRIPGNKLNLKTKNLFVDFEKLKQNDIKKEFLDLIESSEIERIIFKVENTMHDFLELLKDLKSETQIFVVRNQKSYEKDCEKFDSHEISHNWNDLVEESKEEIKNKFVKINEKSCKVSKILEGKISSEILSILCSNNEISIFYGTKVLKLNFFIPRIVGKTIKYEENCDETIKNFQNFTLDDFVQNTLIEQIVIISDIAGSGKTTFLHKVREILIESFPTFYILFIELREFIDEISKCVGESFQEFIIKILNLNFLEQEIFNQKFSKGEIKILFDAFDEISPKCKEETLKLFKLFKECESKNQIWITTRTHLEHDLESELKVESYKLKILNESKQIKFLKLIWKNSHRNEKFIAKCAEKLVKKISNLMSSHQDVIGVPLIIEGLAKYFRNEINDNFIQNIKVLKINSIYEKIVIEASFKILRIKFPEKVEEHLNKSESILKVHQFWALVYLFDEEFANNMGFSYDTDEWPLEEISRGGILSYDKNDKIKFNHETYAEFLLALIVFNFIKNSSNPSNLQLELLIKVIKSQNFEVTRMFLEETLENFRVDFKIFKSWKKVCDAMEREEDKFDFLNYLSRENLSEFLIFILEFPKHENLELYEKLIEAQNWQQTTTLMQILPNIKSEIKFSKLLNEIFDFYGEKVLDKFLLKLNWFGDSIFHCLMNDKFSAKNLKTFWQKVEEKNLNPQEIGKIFIPIQNRSQTILYSCISAYETNFEKVETFFDILKNNLSLEKQKELIRIKKQTQNIFDKSVEKDKKLFDLVLNFVASLMSKEEFKIFLSENDCYNKNVFHCVIRETKTPEMFESLWIKISENFAQQEQRKFYVENDFFFQSLMNHKTTEVFEFVFELATKLFTKNKIIENFLEKNYFFVVEFSSKENILKFFEQTFKFLNENELEEFLQRFKSEFGMEIVRLASKNENFNLIELLWEFLNLKIFIKGDLKNVLNFFLECKNFWAQKLYDCLTSNNLLEELKLSYENFNRFNFDFKRSQILKGKNEFKSFLKLKLKKNRNFLHIAATENFESASVNFIFSIFRNIFSDGFLKPDKEFEEILFHFDSENLTPLHYAAKNCSAETFKVFLYFYEEYFLDDFSSDQASPETCVFIYENGESFFEFLKTIPFKNLEIVLEKLTTRFSFHKMNEILNLKTKEGKNLSNFLKNEKEIRKLIKKALKSYSSRQRFMEYFRY